MADDRAREINGGDDEDEALRIAIAMSLGQDPAASQPGRSRKPELIDLTQDEDGDGDGDGVADRGKPAARHETDPQQSQRSAPSGNPPPAPPSSSSVLGLDRKKMEEERLARLNKRKASEVGGDDAAGPRLAQRPRVAPGPPSPAPREQLGTAPTANPKTPAPSSAPKPALPYPYGAVKKTWAFGEPRPRRRQQQQQQQQQQGGSSDNHDDNDDGDDRITIEEVLQKRELELAVLSSYQWDEEWLLAKVDVARTRVVLVAFAADEAQRREMRANVPAGRIRFCFPPMAQPPVVVAGAMHSKLLLLKYEAYVRVVVPTGNLMSFDWGETGTMENVRFFFFSFFFCRWTTLCCVVEARAADW